MHNAQDGVLLKDMFRSCAECTVVFGEIRKNVMVVYRWYQTKCVCEKEGGTG